MTSEKIILAGGQPLEKTKIVEIGEETYTLKYPTTEEWMDIMSSAFNGSISSMSQNNYEEALFNKIVEEKVDVNYLSMEDSKELISEIKEFVDDVEEDELEITIQAYNMRWYKLAREKYLLQGQPDFKGYVKDMLKNTIVENLKITDLTPVQAVKLRGEVDKFFRTFKPTPKRIERKVQE